MDDANNPSLLSVPYFGYVNADDPVYQNTRKFVWSKHNPYFFKGTVAEGIGGPHCGKDKIWPMSIISKALTSEDKEEIAECLRVLVNRIPDLFMKVFIKIILQIFPEVGLRGPIHCLPNWY